MFLHERYLSFLLSRNLLLAIDAINTNSEQQVARRRRKDIATYRNITDDPS